MDAGVWMQIITRTVIFFLGIPGNISILLVYRKRKTGGSTRIYIMAIAVVDLGVCLLSPAIIYNSIETYANIIFCKLFVFAYVSLVFLSLLLMVLIGIDRYFKICHSIRIKTSPRRAKLTVTICTIFCFGFNTPFLLFLTLKKQDDGVICAQSAQGDFQDITTSTIYLIAFAIAFGCYGLIYRNVKGHSKVRARMFGAPGLQPGGAGSTMRPQPSGSRVAPSVTNTAEDHISHGISNDGASTVPSVSGSIHLDKSATLHPDRQAWKEHAVNSVSNNNALSQQNIASTAQNERGEGDRKGKTDKVKSKRAPLDKTTKMMLAVTVIYFLTWVPEIIIVTLFERLISTELNNVFVELIIALLRDLFAVNQIINPVIYGLINKKFREDVLRVLKR
ncbi:muscarinic acetylcholine receptor M1-like [Lytechinus variegatus]|uniref:muscarinic acetylcholine receptor M1-like n=1 Tax=Lytechinus variegatus TaxID=7654 RepID=UPI001BB1CB76|nr:muscarinic acetylcholine receptor M1-like [Lytechinus variegatus]